MRKYLCLSGNQSPENGRFKIVPIRHEDRFDIMQWRNEQIYHLRQNSALTSEAQENYFNTTVAELFTLEKPNQLLFSFLQDEKCIGYGGLVHINWIDRNAEISFIMNTSLEKDHFALNWGTFLELLEKIAFSDLNFHKIYVYAFDLRPHLYEALLLNDFKLDARLKEHCLFDSKYIDVVIHSKWNKN